MKYKPSEEKLNCTICGIDTPETIEGTPLCFDCIEQMQTGDRSDIVEAVERHDMLKRKDHDIALIVSKISEFTGIKDICQKTRKREIVEARQIGHFISKKNNCGSLAFIGREIGMVDHATVLHSIKTVKNLYKTDKIYRDKNGGIIEYYGGI